MADPTNVIPGGAIAVLTDRSKGSADEQSSAAAGWGPKAKPIGHGDGAELIGTSSRGTVQGRSALLGGALISGGNP